MYDKYEKDDDSMSSCSSDGSSLSFGDDNETEKIGEGPETIEEEDSRHQEKSSQDNEASCPKEKSNQGEVDNRVTSNQEDDNPTERSNDDDCQVTSNQGQNETSHQGEQVISNPLVVPSQELDVSEPQISSS